MIAKSYFSSIFRCAKIGTQPRTTLSHIVRGYLPLLMQLGHDPNHTLNNMIEGCYFPLTNSLCDTLNAAPPPSPPPQQQQHQKQPHSKATFPIPAPQWINYAPTR